jgi:hypothetical protein
MVVVTPVVLIASTGNEEAEPVILIDILLEISPTWFDVVAFVTAVNAKSAAGAAVMKAVVGAAVMDHPPHPAG